MSSMYINHVVVLPQMVIISGRQRNHIWVLDKYFHNAHDDACVSYIQILLEQSKTSMYNNDGY